MTKHQELKTRLAIIEAECTQLSESIKPKMDVLTAQAKIVRDDLEILAVERLQEITIDKLADPFVYLEVSELLWNDGRGISFEHDALRDVFAGTYIYRYANFLESYAGAAPRYLASFSLSIPLRTDELKFTRTAEAAALLLRAAYEVDPERAVIELMSDSESYVTPKIRFDGTSFALYTIGSLPDLESADMIEIFKRAPRAS